MNLSKTRLLVFFLVFLSAYGWADVQWLRYRTSARIDQELSASTRRVYRQFEAQRPQGVRCPEFVSDQPRFIKWDSPMDSRGFRWVALDRSTAHGRYDRLYIDTNGDGHLDDETPHQGRQQDQYNVGFDPVPVYLTGDDGLITYHLSMEFYSYNEQSTYLRISTGGFYEGTVLIDGNAVACLLIDYNGNGTFDDTAEDFNGDRIWLGQGNGRREFYVGRYIEYDDRLYRLNVSRDGAFIGLTSAPDVPYGVVEVPAAITKFSAGGRNGLYEKIPQDGRVRLPEGEYRIQRWEIARKDKGQDWTLSGSGFPRAQTFSVRPDVPAAMDVGEPVFSRLSVTERSGVYAVNQTLRGKQGEQISLLRNGRQPAAPKVSIRTKTGDYDRTFSLEYG